jgi:very-short-patch-repair endonuclease
MSTHDSSYDLSTEAAYLRQHPSQAERLLLEHFADNAPAPFEFQSIVTRTIVSFYFETVSLAVLIEDESHDHSDGYYRQIKLIETLEKADLKVLILPAYEVLKDIEKSVEKISTLCHPK